MPLVLQLLLLVVGIVGNCMWMVHSCLDEGRESGITSLERGLMWH